MKITVIGATGGIGSAIVAQALESGHHVTAVARNPAKVDAHARVAFDLTEPDPAVLASAMEGAEAVLSAIGPRRRSEWGIVSRGTAAIAEAMSEAGARRILIITGVGISTVRTPNRPNPTRREPGAGFVMRRFATPLARAVIGEHMSDVAMAEEILADSDLEWTSVRVPYLSDAPLTGVYKVAYGVSLPRALRLGRADAAHFMLGAINEPRAFEQPVTVAY